MHPSAHSRRAPRSVGLLSSALCAPLFASLFAGAVTSGAEESAEARRYEATIRRTSWGIPHIRAADLGSLGFGEGYAQAEDHLCSVADQVVRARGERARYFGRGEQDSNLLSDLGMKALRVHERAGEELAALPQEHRDWIDGYVAGYNQWLEERGKQDVPGWCRGQEWVVPITATDLAARQRMVILIATHFVEAIGQAQLPAATAGPSRGFGVAPSPGDRGSSNGWALGRDLAEGGRGMLVANPHYPWVGANRFWEKHLTIPGDLDVYGVGLIGIPGVAIGFNRAVAWTHTVSAGTRFTLYSLDLVPGKPTTYRYGPEEREMAAVEVSVEVAGEPEPVRRTQWFSHYGPIVELGGLDWTEERAYAIRDVNEFNDEAQLQWLAMGRSNSMREFQQAHARHQGMPWVNTISTSAEGIAWFTDSSATPNLTRLALTLWKDRRETDDLARQLWEESGIVLLDGSDPRFEWQTDSDARDPGLVAFSRMPQLERTDYVFNANDSFWLANSRALLEGDISPMHGEQRTVRSMRTRNNELHLSNATADRPAGDDGKFSLAELEGAILSNRSLAADLLIPELVARCKATPRVAAGDRSVDLGEACSHLEHWDRRFDVDSRGAVLFREWITLFSPADLAGKGDLFAVDFDPSEPVTTPRGLAEGAQGLENLAKAVSILAGRELRSDVALGELQYPPSKLPARIPIHGGYGAWEGVLNLQQSGVNLTTLEPLELAPRVEGSRYLTESGYPVVHGSSFLMALEYTDRGPNAEAFLTYSESGDPHSTHFRDQTELFSRKQWRSILFDEASIAADTKRESTVTGRRR